MTFTIYFYGRQHSSQREGDHFASPAQEFNALEDARSCAKHAADTTMIQTTLSFRIKSEDGKINERWIRDGNAWKLKS
jgi:hypothetical protein